MDRLYKSMYMYADRYVRAYTIHIHGRACARTCCVHSMPRMKTRDAYIITHMCIRRLIRKTQVKRSTYKVLAEGLHDTQHLPHKESEGPGEELDLV